MWRFMNPLALQPSPAARRAQSAKRESWKWNNDVTGPGNLRKACLSPLPATWLCPTVSFCCLASGLLGLSPATQRIVRLRSMEQGRVLLWSMFKWCRFSLSCLHSNPFLSLSGNQLQSCLYLWMPTNRYVLWYNRIGPLTDLLFLF